MLRILTFSILFLLHPVHVSITSIEYVPEVRSFKVFIRMYFDDFLLDSNLENNEASMKKFSSLNPESRDVLTAYLREKIIIKADEQQLSARLREIKLADNEINIYIDYPVGKKPQKVSVESLLLTSLYDDQSNMVILRVNEFEEGVKLNPGMTEKTFLINNSQK